MRDVDPREMIRKAQDAAENAEARALAYDKGSSVHASVSCGNWSRVSQAWAAVADASMFVPEMVVSDRDNPDGALTGTANGGDLVSRP